MGGFYTSEKSCPGEECAGHLKGVTSCQNNTKLFGNMRKLDILYHLHHLVWCGKTVDSLLVTERLEICTQKSDPSTGIC